MPRSSPGRSARSVAYAHWLWCQFRRDREYMTKVYPDRRRAILHTIVLLALVLMASELIWRVAIGYGAV